MVKAQSWKTYTATVADSDGDKHDSSVEGRTSEGGEQVPTVAGTRDVGKGDVVVRTGNPGVFDVVSRKDWADSDWKGEPKSESKPKGKAQPATRPPKVDQPTTPVRK